MIECTCKRMDGWQSEPGGGVWLSPWYYELCKPWLYRHWQWDCSQCRTDPFIFFLLPVCIYISIYTVYFDRFDVAAPFASSLFTRGNVMCRYRLRTLFFFFFFLHWLSQPFHFSVFLRPRWAASFGSFWNQSCESKRRKHGHDGRQMYLSFSFWLWEHRVCCCFVFASQVLHYRRWQICSSSQFLCEWFYCNFLQKLNQILY